MHFFLKGSATPPPVNILSAVLRMAGALTHDYRLSLPDSVARVLPARVAAALTAAAAQPPHLRELSAALAHVVHPSNEILGLVMEALCRSDARPDSVMLSLLQLVQHAGMRASWSGQLVERVRGWTAMVRRAGSLSVAHDRDIAAALDAELTLLGGAH